MSYPLRLPPELDEAARQRCKRLGISLNALIAVALDEYLRRVTMAAVEPAASLAGRGALEGAPARSKRRRSKAVEDVAAEIESSNYDPSDWRYFDPDPAVWPYVDPDPAWRARLQQFGADAGDEATMQLIEKEYWSTRKRP